MSAERVVLVNMEGEPIGLKEKMQAHIDGDLHLAFSVLLYRQNQHGEREYLLHQRAMGKYHSEGLWTNTCCSHPRQGETFEAAGTRRLKEEMGIDLHIPLTDIGQFVYRADLDNQLVEHELDHVLIADMGLEPSSTFFEPNPEEVMAFEWVQSGTLREQLKQYPAHFTTWFSKVFSMAEQRLTDE